MREIKTAIIAVVALTLVLGVAYPLAMTGIAQVAYPHRADGRGDLIGRDFSKQKAAFQSRPSATGYSATATFFNNQGPNQKALADQLKGFVRRYLEREGPYTPGLSPARIPSDAVTTSASGVDPDISVANARIQANRVARLSGLSRRRVLALVDDRAHRPLLGLAGDRSVNVAALNRDLARER